MGRREIEKRLQQYAAACEKIVPENKESKIRELMQTGITFSPVTDFGKTGIVRTRGTLWNFIWEQIGYLGRYCLIWQAVWIGVFWYMMRHGAHFLFGAGNENAVLAAISLLPPLLVLLTVEEVTRIYQRSMLEIEYATKYSLRSAVMVRMLVLSAAHSFLLLACMIFLHVRVESDMGQLLVYGFTPMVIMTAVMVKLMQRCQGELLRGMTVGAYLSVAVFLMLGSRQYFDWYQPAYFRAWCIACAAGIVMAVRQFICLNGKLLSCEVIMQCSSDS